MKLSQHDLQQLDEGILQGLPEAVLRRLSVNLLADLKEARERLQQHPGNSSRPPSSRAPWERGSSGQDTAPRDASADADALPEGDDVTEAEEALAEQTVSGQAPASAEASADDASAAAPRKPKRKPGKQAGAPGFGRTQVFQAQREERHHPPHCARCGQALPPEAPQTVYTGFQSIDVRWGDPGTPGLQLEVVDHRYLEVTCGCGHCTRAPPAQGEVEETLAGIALREWRLVGPGLASFIVALNLRFRLSRARIQEFLHDWLGVRLSIGTLHQTLHETGAVVAPAEGALIADLLAEAEAQGVGGPMHADETSWPQQDQRLWLWVFLTTTTTVYVIAGRGKATVTRLLAGFQGWLMSDGWFSYRDYPRRLRCWAHLLRKAQGLIERYDRDARRFGIQVRGTLEDLMAAIYAARVGPPPEVDLREAHAEALQRLRQACSAQYGHRHEKTRALATEFLHDWDAIFRVLEHPALALTNNAAEQALRHWVISRRISHGTRTAVGSRVFALLASVIDSCRQRGHSPWTYLAEAIAERRAGRPLPPLPQPGV